MLSEAVKISMLFLPYNFCPALCGALFLCPQKQCLSGKEDGLSGRTNQRLPPGGSSRQSRGRESALRYNQYKSKVARAPSSRRKAILVPDSTPKKCNTPYHAARRAKKDRDEKSLSFCNVGAFIERPRATTGRPYKFVFYGM